MDVFRPKSYRPRAQLAASIQTALRISLTLADKMDASKDNEVEMQREIAVATCGSATHLRGWQATQSGSTTKWSLVHDAVQKLIDVFACLQLFNHRLNRLFVGLIWR